MTGLKSETFKYDETVRYIVHLDMDAFFAAVEQRDNPQLMGKPVIIGADPRQGKGRGVVSTCSYEARKFGVHSAMPISRAYKLCPQGIYLSGSHKKYSLISKQIFTIMYDFSPDIEPVSIDEAFIDITRTWHLFNSPENVCIQLKKRIYKELGLKCSTGLASNKLVAKIASDFDKPDGMVIVPHDKTAQFLEPLDVKRMWGIGKVCLKTLHSMNIYTLGQLAGASSGMIKSMFGDNGLKLQARARGIDNRPVAVNDEIKSVSNEYTFDEDTGDIDTIMGVIMHLSEKVAWRLQAKNLKGQKVSVKIRTSDFCTYTRDKSIDRQIDYDLDIFTIARNLFNTFKQTCNLKNLKYRLLGVKVSGFNTIKKTIISRPVQQSLFEKKPLNPINNEINKTDSNVKDRPENLKKALEKIRKNFGKDAISRGISSKINIKKNILTDKPVED